MQVDQDLPGRVYIIRVEPRGPCTCSHICLFYLGRCIRVGGLVVTLACCFQVTFVMLWVVVWKHRTKATLWRTSLSVNPKKCIQLTKYAGFISSNKSNYLLA